MAREIVRTENLVKRYGSVTALRGISLEIQQGEFIALLGPSGCGKTTTLRCLAGFIEPTEGKVWIDGKLMNKVPPYRRPVNTVFQNYALFPHLTVGENVAYGPRRKGISRSEIDKLIEDALATVGMQGFKDRYASQLSGGQQQRVALARAIINKPMVLLLDEPLGALDLKLRKQMQLELKHLQSKLDISFVYVTHDQEEALVMADRIAVMNEGEIVQLGSGREIYDAPNSRFVADFIGEANLLPCRVGARGEVLLAESDMRLPYAIGEGGKCDAVLVVRPEHIVIVDDTAGEDLIVLCCRVREKVFVGDAIRVYVVTESGLEFMIQPESRERAEALDPGQAIKVGWRRDRGRLVVH